MDTSASFWLPSKASTFAPMVDSTFNLYLWLSVFFFVLVCGLIAYFTFKYIRKRPDQLATAQVTHNLKLELTWTLIPLVLVMFLFFLGMKGYLHMRVAPQNFAEVKVIGQKWSWIYEYPSGATNDTLVVPVNTPVRLVMHSRDVLHSFYVPEFRVKADVIPGRYHTLWFEATRTGSFKVFCTEYCGTNHSYMLSGVKVLDYPAYEEWLAAASDPGKGKTPEEFGKVLYTKKGCNACHTLDGSKGIGPTWKGLFGRSEALANGQSVSADENYIRSSIYEPNAQVVAGYQPVMPTYKGILKDNEVDALISYIKTLK